MINLSVIKNIARIKKCVPGSMITGASSGNALFIVLKGEIGVFINHKLPNCTMVRTLGAGELFTDPSLLQDKKTVYTTVALCETIILPVDTKGALDFIREEPAIVFEMIKDLSARLDSTVKADKSPAEKSDLKQRQNGKASSEKNTQVDRAKQSTEALVNAVLAQSQKAHIELVKSELAHAELIHSEPVIPAAAIPESSVRNRFPLFPEEHKQYHLTICEPDSPSLMTKPHTCPICKGSFTAATVRPSKLVVATTDADLRYHYKGIEPLYYEVLTCPHCLYSALPDVFDAPDKSKTDIQRELALLTSRTDMAFDQQKNTDTVFAGFYLAQFCAPISFINNQIILGRLLYKLSRVYHDAGDEKLENATAAKALEHFLEAYARMNMQPSQEQQVCITIGELYYKQNDLRNAITFFGKAKSINSSVVLKNHADGRIYDIRAKVTEANM